MDVVIDNRLPYRIGSPILPALPVVGDQSRHETLLVISKATEESALVWALAVTQIRKHFNTIGLNYEIEIIDQRAHEGLHTMAIDPIQLNVNNWNEEILPTILQHLNERKWLSVDILRREHPLAKDLFPMSVVISAQDADNQDWWENILPGLRRYLNTNKMSHVQIVVLFLQDLFLCDGIQTPPNMELLHTVYGEKDEWPMGASCSRAGVQSSGTLGCRVVLQSEDKSLYMGLTNFHVLKGSNTSSVVIPSDPDHQIAIETSKKDVELAQDKVDYDQEKAIAKGCEAQESYQVTLRHQEMQQQNISNFDRQAGTIYATSGFSVWTESDKASWIMDWGLFQTAADRTVSPRLPYHGGARLKSIRGDRYGSILRKEYVYDVIKRGRSSGWTKGTISAIQSAVQVSLLPPVEAAGPSQIQIPEYGPRALYCFAIITKNHTPFLQSGDSGAAIMLNESGLDQNDGVIVGLGFTRNTSTEASYMIPIDLVMKSIEKDTDCKIVEPFYVGEVEAQKLGTKLLHSAEAGYFVGYGDSKKTKSAYILQLWNLWMANLHSSFFRGPKESRNST
ncbi:hypothetical protein P154DRAFT_577921 [Amniculicola lignicola CBS 123094]|uniref:Uncharacterized protein n=1 Tax=Amniculicola lignicola CBS 123094 TaxID=1392246 RepID=A0A6A5WCP9_9PLEO|nr:hypothetical protein P154DRAFT_577921 [Amniculicola lignicola CBS 123094]